jgi:hypothetical protein
MLLFFSIESLDFLFMPAYSSPGNNVHYTVRCGVETTAVRITCVDSLELCGPESNLDLTHFIWKTFAYYCTNYAIAVLPSQNFNNKIVYVRHYKAEIGWWGGWVRNLRLVEGAFGTLKTLACFTTLGVRNPTNSLAPYFVNSPFL